MLRKWQSQPRYSLMPDKVTIDAVWIEIWWSEYLNVKGNLKINTNASLVGLLKDSTDAHIHVVQCDYTYDLITL